MEDYYITLSPDFELSPTEFVVIWNEEEECRAVAIARVVRPDSQQYDFNLLAQILLTVVSGIVTNVASSAVYDLIKKVIAKREGSSKHVHIEALQKPDGTRFLVIDSDEEEK